MKLLPGPKSKALFNEEQRHLASGLQSIALFSELVIQKAQGVYLEDLDGNRFIDLTAGIGVGSIGHSHPHYVKLLSDQIQKITFGSFTTENRVQFLKLLTSMAPHGLDSAQLYSGGAEAVEAALRLAKSVTKKFEFVGFSGGFHGKTGGVLGLLGDTSFKKGLGPMMPGLHSMAGYAYCYRCPLKMRHPECALACVELFRSSIKHQTTHSIAAIIVEPMQGTAGNVIPPKGFLTAVKEVAKEFDALLIADEMLTGFGRTGKMWGCDHEQIIPDVMTVGKGIGGGFPLSAIVSSKKNTSTPPFGNPSGSSSSYGGNPLAATAGRAALETIMNEKLVENSQKIGALILTRLQEIKEKSSIIGNVRGLGLMIGVELVEDKKSKVPLGKKYTRQLFHECLKRGLISMCYSHNIRINPPLVINASEAEEAVNILEESLNVIAKEHRKN
ncbi:MAG: aspartate aminotransferase family protein [Chlamydiota bacterium]|nr:aspartate aminotransferase family protein [Chlamydiota bacterium]